MKRKLSRWMKNHQKLQELGTEDKYDKPQPVDAVRQHSLKLRLLPDDQTAEEIEHERQEIESMA